MVRHDRDHDQIGRCFDVREAAAGPAIKFENRADLLVLRGLIEAGKVTPVVDKTYPLSQTGEAIGHVGLGHARGTVVINMYPSNHKTL